MSRIVPPPSDYPRVIHGICGNCGFIDLYSTDVVEKYCEFDCTRCGAKNKSVFLKFDSGKFYKFGLDARRLYWN